MMRRTLRAMGAHAGAAALVGSIAGAAALVVVALSPHIAAALDVTGHVLKGEARQPTSGISVSLHVVKGEEELPGKTAVTGADGSFRFSDLSADPTLSYFLSTEYAGAFYTEGPIDTEAKGEATHDLVIYDVGRDIGSVRVTNHHVLVERDTDHLHITEILVFENAWKTAYLGTGLNHAENVGIRLGLPASVKHFEPGMGADPQSVQVQGRDLASFRPIPPGTHPFSFTYDVPFSGRMDLSHRLYFPTDRVVVLISDPNLKLDSKSLRDMGQTEQGGRKFQLYQGAVFPIGAEITMRVGGAGFWSNPGIYPWLVAPFLIVAVLIFAARRGRKAGAPTHEMEAGAGGRGSAPAGGHPAPAAGGPPAPATFPGTGRGSSRPASTASPGNGDDFAAVYLYLIEALDRGLERGEFSKESYTLIRGNLKRRLETILSDHPRTGTR